jgi:hypothetical protein
MEQSKKSPRRNPTDRQIGDGARGERTFPLERQDIKAGTIEEGALVTAELNEAGSVIDLHRAKQ